MQEEYIAARMKELAGVYRPDGKAPSDQQLREFTINMMRRDCDDVGISRDEFEAAMKTGNVGTLHGKAREISVDVFETSSRKREKVRRLQMIGIALLVTGFIVFIFSAF